MRSRSECCHSSAREGSALRHNVAFLCQPRPSAWVTVGITKGSPQRGGPHHRSSSSMTCFVLVQLRAAPLGLSDLWGLATQADGLGWHRLAPSGLNRRRHRERGVGCATLWFLSLVAERPSKVAVGFHPRSAIPPNHLVAERRWNHRHTIGRQRDVCRRLHTFPRRSATNDSRVISA